jgi:arylsulfatase A-like enzyme
MVKIKIVFKVLCLSMALSCSNKTSKKQQIALNSEIPKPNIIFIMADDMGYADAGCYGQEVIRTPNIDMLSEEGIQFTQCYAGSAVCAPSRSVLLTGKHAGHTRVRGNFGLGGVIGLAGKSGRVPLKEEDVTIAEMLQEAGYATAMVGKWGLGEPYTSGTPGKKGFDEFYGFLNQRRAHTYYPEYIWKDTNRVELALNKAGQKVEYTHDLFADYALDFIERHNEEPFFLYLPFCIPHSHYEIPDLGIYADKNWSDNEKAYAAMISRMDHTIGRIIDLLKELKIDDNTYVFFTSDNGAASESNDWGRFDSNGPLRGSKRDPYEGGIRVPMLVRNPQKIVAGKTNDQVWHFIDVLPTLAQIADIPYPEEIDGISLLPALSGNKRDLGERTLYWEFYELDGWRATRFGDWKAIQHDMNKDTHAPIELYNLRDDIGETTNVADQYPELVAKAVQIFQEEHEPSEEYVWGYNEAYDQ